MNFGLFLFIVVALALMQTGAFGRRNEGFPGSKGLECIREWERRARYLRVYNPETYARMLELLSTFARHIRSIERLRWNRLARHKRLLPDLSRDIVNTFHSMVHSLPPDELEGFNLLLESLNGYLMETANRTVRNFYDSCPQIAERENDHEINLTKDWFVHDYHNPDAFDPAMNNRYDFI